MRPAKDLQLVPKDEYLEFVGVVWTAPAEDPAELANDEEREEGHRRMVDEPQVRPDVRVPAPHRLTAAERRRPCRADLSGSADPHEA